MPLAAPTLSSATPADDTSAVALDSNIVLTFSANMVFGSGTITHQRRLYPRPIWTRAACCKRVGWGRPIPGC